MKIDKGGRERSNPRNGLSGEGVENLTFTLKALKGQGGGVKWKGKGRGDVKKGVGPSKKYSLWDVGGGPQVEVCGGSAVTTSLPLNSHRHYDVGVKRENTKEGHVGPTPGKEGNFAREEKKEKGRTVSSSNEKASLSDEIQKRKRKGGREKFPVGSIVRGTLEIRSYIRPRREWPPPTLKSGSDWKKGGGGGGRDNDAGASVAW